LHNKAWMQATNPEAKYRNGKAALAAATKACELTGHKDGVKLCALAAAYAEVGQFDQAAKWQTAALELVPADHKQAAQAMLAGFKVGKPYREDPPGKVQPPVGPWSIVKTENTGQVSGTVTVHYMPGQAPPGRSGSNELHFVPTPGVPVRVLLPDKDDVLAETKTDEQGRYSFTLPPGDYRIEAGYSPNTRMAEPVPVTVKAGSTEQMKDIQLMIGLP
jgi:hypothetical protein